MRDVQSIFTDLRVHNSPYMTSLFPRSVVYLMKGRAQTFPAAFLFHAAFRYRLRETIKRVYISANYFLINRTSVAISAFKSPFGKTDNVALEKAST